MIHHGAARAEAAARHPRCLTAPPSPEQYAPRRPEGVPAYILRRLLALAPTLFFASLIVFVTVSLIPGNVIDLRYAKLCQTHGIRVRPIVRLGAPAESIVKTAREENVDLIVLGMRRADVIDRLLGESIAGQMTRMAPCHVLSVKPQRKS